MGAMTSDQKRVLRGMAFGAAITVAVLGAAVVAPNAMAPGETTQDRLTLIAVAFLPLALSVFATIAALARHRFVEPRDIDAAAGTNPTPRAWTLDAANRNTVEQATFAALTYVPCALLLPGDWTDAVVCAAVLFAVGRACFVAGYARGAPARAFGFALSFYPTIGLLLLLAGSMFV